MTAILDQTILSADWRRFLMVLAIVGLGVPFLALFYQLRITDCAGYGYEADTYLAQCASKSYGDFEHGLLALQMNAKVIDHLQRAQVVVLGHSHSMVAFSTVSTRQYFRQTGIKFFNAALSGENSTFFDFLFSRVRLGAKVIIIDISPFFVNDGNMSSVGRFIVESPIRASVEYRIKKVWQLLHRYSCTGKNAVVSQLCGKAFSTFRSMEDGRLIADYTLAYGSPLPKNPVALRTRKESLESEPRIKLAKEFVVRNKLNAACLVLTAIPTGYDLSSLAKDIAQAIGASYINPQIDGLTTIDGAHLDLASATAWSERFWNEATPTIDRCLT